MEETACHHMVKDVFALLDFKVADANTVNMCLSSLVDKLKLCLS
jgi:hypothetical protein